MLNSSSNQEGGYCEWCLPLVLIPGPASYLRHSVLWFHGLCLVLLCLQLPLSWALPVSAILLLSLVFHWRCIGATSEYSRLSFSRAGKCRLHRDGGLSEVVESFTMRLLGPWMVLKVQHSRGHLFFWMRAEEQLPGEWHKARLYARPA